MQLLELATVRAFIAALNARDFAPLSALMASDYTLIDAHGRMTTGCGAALKSWADFRALFPDSRRA